MTVQDYLTGSQAKHLQAQALRKKGDRAGHLEACRMALDLRLQAHAADPEHTHPAWAAEVLKKFHHERLIVFYEHELAITESERVRTRDEIAAAISVPKGVALEDSEAFTACVSQ